SSLRRRIRTHLRAKQGRGMTPQPAVRRLKSLLRQAASPAGPALQRAARRAIAAAPRPVALRKADPRNADVFEANPEDGVDTTGSFPRTLQVMRTLPFQHDDVKDKAILFIQAMKKEKELDVAVYEILD